MEKGGKDGRSHGRKGAGIEALFALCRTPVKDKIMG